jgi:osmoprotectant transport system ATP-binding protein
MIALRHVTKTFGGRVALDDVSLIVQSGATHVLLGSTGSGKSTILKVILGLVRPDAGEVHVEPATRMGYVVQEGALYPHLTAVSNITLPARAAGWSPARQAARLEELSVLVGLDPPLLRVYPRELSGGQRQRVSLLRALILDPPVLLLDEPTAAMDMGSEDQFKQRLAAVLERRTLIVVTHRDSMLSIVDKLVVMDGGRVVAAGPKAEVLAALNQGRVRKAV